MIEHPEAERVDPIAGDVHAIWRDSHERYGARKIKAALERRGVTASRRRIVNIMKRRGMTSAYARRTFKPHKTRVNEARLANILDREFDGYEPRTHLASDLTYVRVGGKWAYVCLLIDLANRSIAGHSADTGRTADLVMAAFATLDFPLTEVEVFHTDRGSEFDNAKIDEPPDVFDIRRSLSRKGNPYDNAVVESTNRLLKKELIYRNHYTSLEQLRSDLNDYVWWSVMNIGLERPIGLEAGHTYHIRLVVDDTIGTLYVDGVALNVRMYERPGESLGVFATDGTVEVRNASIARGLKRK